MESCFTFIVPKVSDYLILCVSLVIRTFQVDFEEIKDQYSYKEPLVCTFSLKKYETQPGDRVAIFKLGWASCKDYVRFEWVPLDANHVVFHGNLLSYYYI